MRTFKTPKGTELPLTDLKGKDYLNVAYRLVWFREVHPHGRIDTERLSESEHQVTYRATVSVLIDSAEKTGTGYSIKLSNADKTMNIKSTLDYEKCETAAVGRALARAGFGTQFAEDIHEGEDIADAPIDPKSNNNGSPHKVDLSNRKFSIGKHTGKTFKQVLETDSVQNWTYSRWLNKQDKTKTHQDQKDFLEYAKAEGVDLNGTT